MSILIKGGKMPKNCDKCFLSSSMGLRCDAANKSLATDTYPKRPSWCPLVEVPEPHGRLIDAEMLSSQFHKDTGSLHLVTTHGFVSECIEDASTVIEAEGEEQCE